MRFLYVKLTGYIGLYNGLGINEIEIDFTKCKNKITVISGPNGVGKSTIINALSLLPDSNDNFVPTMNASKFIRLTDGENLYEIYITHPLDKHNSRATSKASITKNGVELNSNGNISSYKEVIFSEFDMDANYIALSKISGDNRGLADKKPAERKKIMSSLIASLDTYNNIYKVLNKKANIFKSHFTSLANKIKGAGDENSLRSSLSALEEKEIRLSQAIDKAKEQITESKTILSMNDPNGSMQTQYHEVVEAMNSAQGVMDLSYKKLCRMFDNSKIDFMDRDELEGIISNLRQAITNNMKETEELKLKSEMIVSLLASLSTDIDKLQIKIDGISSDIDQNIVDNINLYSSKVKEIETSCARIGITDMEDISKNEIEIMITVLIKIVRMIDVLYEVMSTDQFAELYEYASKGIDIDNEISGYQDNIESIKKLIAEIKEDLVKVNSDIQIVEVLSNRPDNCNDDNCHFVKNALETLKLYGTSIEDVYKKRDNYNLLIKDNQRLIAELEKIIEDKKITRFNLTKLGEIMSLIESNRQILSKFSIASDIIDTNRFLELISRENRFNNLRDLDKYLELGNSLIEYKSNLSILRNLEAKMEINQRNLVILHEYEDELNRKLEEKKSRNEELFKIRKDREFVDGLIYSNTTKLDTYEKILSIYNEWKISESDYKNYQAKAEEIKNKFDSSLGILSKIEELQEFINNTLLELKPIAEQKKAIESQLTLLDSFKVEYEMYKEKYEFVDKLRTYSSPTKGSIQSLFMSIYMDKTLSMVNQLLGMIFNGQYRIQQYVIDADEFRIPFIGNGMPVDDISSGSTSQVCIMGMIINLVLADCSSSKYNIVSLDEIDGGLDHVNRYLFVDVLQKICDILNIEQLFIISHSVESALSNVDVVLLSDSQEYIDQFSSANIIYRFSNK